jgi:putative two-component system response regulator
VPSAEDPPIGGWGDLASRSIISGRCLALQTLHGRSPTFASSSCSTARTRPGSRGLETPGHLERIGEYSRLLARAAGLGTEEAERIRLAAPLHDVGKVAIADAILLKEGELDIAEREEMQRHAEAGHELLGGCTSDILQLAGEIALTHHERFDGRGYPQGLSDDTIPLPGRIVAVADVFDALICDRPHRRAMSLEDAVKVMLRGRGAHFDPRLLDHFLLDLDAMLAAASRTTDLDLVQTL